MSYFQVTEACNGCLACVQNCPARALDARDEGDRRTLLHNMTRCARCATCWRVCPQHAVDFRHLLVSGWDEVVTLPLVRCEACGEPVHTGHLLPSMAPDLTDFALPLCDRHRALRQAQARREKSGVAP